MEGKVAVVTGASRGIGKAIAVKLASKGATVVINYNGSRERAEEVKNEVESAGGKAVIIQCNVADFDACKEFIETVIKEQGRIDILVNNAGITKDGLLMKMSEEDFDKVLDTNLKGTFHTIRAALRQMIRQRSGRIINMASVVGVSGNAGQANYAASKAGVIGLTKTAAREVASRGITVNAVAPGFIETDMTEVLPEKIKEASAAQIPLGKFGKAEDVANAVAFLASEDAGYITGQVLHVDGGMAEYYCHPADMLIKIPEGMSWEQAAMAEPLTISLHGIHRGGLQAGEYCAIIGAGPIGLVAGMVAQAYGAHAILLDLVQERLDFAKSLGIEYVINSGKEDPVERIKEITGGEMAHQVMECSGANPAIRQTFDLVSNAGRITLTGWPKKETSLPTDVITKKEIDIRGARTSAGEFEEALDLINSRKVDMMKILTKTVTMDEAPDTIVDIEKNPGNYMKVVVRVSNDD